MTCLNACIAVSACLAISKVTENLMESWIFSSCEQETDVVNICSDKGRDQDKIGKESFREHSFKGFSFILYFFFEVLWALGKGLFKTTPQMLGGCIWQGWPSVKAGQPVPPVIRGEGTCRGWLVTPRQGRMPWPHLCDACLVLMICRRSWISAGCLALVLFNLFWVIISENLWRICEVSITMKKQKIQC